MPRRPPVVLALLLATACSGATPGPKALPRATGPVIVPGATGTTATGCGALLAALPATLGGTSLGATSPDPVARRPVTAPGGAAWGDPPITLRCGVPAGAVLDEPYVLDGVRWAVHDDGAVNRWTTLGRRTEVRVLIPDAYDAQGELLIALSPALRRNP